MIFIAASFTCCRHMSPQGGLVLDGVHVDAVPNSGLLEFGFPCRRSFHFMWWGTHVYTLIP